MNSSLLPLGKQLVGEGIVLGEVHGWDSVLYDRRSLKSA